MDAAFGEMLDTTRAERTRYYEMIARLSTDERARKVASLGRSVRELARAAIRQSRPELRADQVELALIARLYGEAVAEQLAPYLSPRRGRS